MHPSGQVAAGSLSSAAGMPPGWYAVYTKHQHEKSAAQLLARKGFDVLLPLYRAQNRWSDRTRIVLQPLFPNYLFVASSLETRVQVLQTAGVCWFISRAGVPLLLDGADFENVRRLAGAPSAQPHAFLDCGDRVRVMRGPLMGLTGILTRVKNQCRVVISLEMTRRAAVVEIDIADVERISAGAQIAPGNGVSEGSRPSLRGDSAQRQILQTAREMSYGK